MKVATLVVAASSIWSVAAQNRADFLPKCAVDCLDTATKQATDCSLDDAVCWCVQKNYEAIYNAGVGCVLQKCGADEATKQVLPGAAKFCAAATASAKAASSTPAPTASASSSGASGNSSATITGSATSTGASTAQPSTASPGAAATAGPIAGAAVLLAGVLAAL